MIEDIKTVMWKEWREIWSGGLRGRIFPLIILLLFGAYFVPAALLASHTDWSEVLVLLVWLPFLFSANIIADSVAGERERHTLETLLASRLPDRSIVLGKMLVTVLYAWGMSLVGAVLGLVVANLSSSTFVMYPTDVLIGIITLSLLAAVFISSLGVLISLKAHTSREAQQTDRIVLAHNPLRLPACHSKSAEQCTIFHYKRGVGYGHAVDCSDTTGRWRPANDGGVDPVQEDEANGQRLKPFFLCGSGPRYGRLVVIRTTASGTGIGRYFASVINIPSSCSSHVQGSEVLLIPA